MIRAGAIGLAAALVSAFGVGNALGGTAEDLLTPCPVTGRSVVSCALSAVSAPPWVAAGLFGGMVALAATQGLMAATLWVRMPSKRFRDWAAILLCSLVGTSMFIAWAAFILESLLDRAVPSAAWWNAVVGAVLVLLWGRRKVSREVTRRLARIGQTG